jgi:hypothetical protein
VNQLTPPSLECEGEPCLLCRAGSGSAGMMADDDLICPPPVSACDHPNAVWLYVRFTLSYRDVEDLLAERGLDVSYERCDGGS